MNIDKMFMQIIYFSAISRLKYKLRAVITFLSQLDISIVVT